VTPPPDLSDLNEAAKDALILAQAAEIAVLIKRIETLAELKAKLNAPPKMPGVAVKLHSST
jgi:hypothetical protein